MSVDSDVVVDTDAVRQLCRRFTSPQIAAVGGWVDVRNKQDNWLTRMQVVRYWFAYHFSKNLEWGFRRVMCLSGCLTAYRRDVLIELEPILENREICGVPIKYGEDRFLTRQVVKAGYLTTMTLTARCRTTVPHTLSGYFSQQLRWRRSNTIDYAGGFTHVWRLNPIIAIHYFSLFALQFAYPIAIVKRARCAEVLRGARDPHHGDGGVRRVLSLARAQAAQGGARRRVRLPAAVGPHAGRLRAPRAARAVHARLRQLGDPRPRAARGRAGRGNYRYLRAGPRRSRPASAAKRAMP